MSKADGFAPRVVAYVPDLMDRSRLAGPVRAAGAELDLVSRPDQLLERMAGAHLVLVDLGRPGSLDAVAALDGGAGERPQIVGFASHVDEATLAMATASGVEALPRSVFFRRLGDLLGGLGGPGALA